MFCFLLMFWFTAVWDGFFSFSHIVILLYFSYLCESLFLSSHFRIFMSVFNGTVPHSPPSLQVRWLAIPIQIVNSNCRARGYKNEVSKELRPTQKQKSFVFKMFLASVKREPQGRNAF